MRSLLELCFLFLNINVIHTFEWDVVGRYEGGKWYLMEAINSAPKKNVLSCEAELDCICGKEGSANVFHCESEFNARLSLDSNTFGDFEIDCNVTLESKKLERDYFSIMEMDKTPEVNLQLNNCPEPLRSYASLFTTSFPKDEGDAKKPMIYKLLIDCGIRKQFVLEKKHFEGLSELTLLEISCAALEDLPADIFQADFPNLIDLKITKTMIRNIPDGLFFNFNALERLTLLSNKIVQIEDDDFRGLINLEKLLIDENNLLSFGENSFNHTLNLLSFSLFNSKVNRLPNSFGKLVALETLQLTNNSIVTIEGICDAFPNLREAIITNNLLNNMGFECFSSFGKANSIVLSANSFSVLPNESVLMNELTTFELSQNAETLASIHRFIESESLTEITMENSNIESIDPDFLHSLPALTTLWLSENKISHLHKDFFAFNPELERIFLNRNRITIIPDGILRNNKYLERLDLISNQIQDLPPSLFSSNRALRILNLGDNLIENIPENLLTNLSSLQRIDLSKNRIRLIKNNSFVGLNSLHTLNIGNNLLNRSVSNSFWPFKNFKNLANLYLNGNFIDYIQPMDELTLRFLNLANNSLQRIEVDTFFNLKWLRKLDLSSNSLENLPNSSFINSIEMEILILEFNNLHDFPSEFLPRKNRINYLDLSGNKIERFDICTLQRAKKIEVLHLSENRMYEIGDLSFCSLEFNALKLLNLSHNQLSFNNSLWSYDWVRKTWGRISPLLIFPNVEEIYLANNSISMVFMDWRNMFLKLKKLDISHNKIQFLSHQDLLFTSDIIMENGTSIPYPCHHFLIVDLQFNQIKKLELPTKMLIQLPKEHNMKLYGHVTINMDNNPFHCGCGIINFLQLLNGDVALTSELRRTEGKEWILPAKLHVGNLSCWLPETVRGKKLAEPHTWMHHIISTLGICSLMETE